MKKLIIIFSIFLCVPLVGCTNSNGDSVSKSSSEQTSSNVASIPEIKIGVVEPTEMDSAYSSSAELINIKPNAKVSGNWNFQIEGMGNASSKDCNPDLKSCFAYFSSDKLKIGQQYKLIVQFSGKTDNTPIKISKEKQFTAEKLQSKD
ncbi:hypothetical protein MK805_00420 [Shimazuella sp. AN120528]|uniref:hypothetical protein n=1 Tax=Shimazuella soli TaxID=1892854 RepID=UPI001F0D0A51|nr:hypothetical protein [Shimazuella soli]MCH5583444.1 hypothetical protein [Shimazuella soli]